ncbi:MAG: hypothetical protein HDS73_04290 [Bacteroidales bacterium]|nr:hypothetical protein [Bacteroidales bacterium]
MKTEYSSKWATARLKELKQGGLLRALRSIGEFIEKHGLREFKGIFENISSTSGYMLDYLRNGFSDPQREDTYNTLAVKTVDLIGAIDRRMLAENSTDTFSGIVRTVNFSGRTVTDFLNEYRKFASLYSIMIESGERDEALVKKRERTLSELFESILVVATLTGDEHDLLMEISTDTEESVSVKYQIIGALLLSLLRNFNLSKFRLLLDIYERTTEESIAARALTAIILTLSEYGELAVFDKGVRIRLEAWQDSIVNYSRLREVEMAIISGFDTPRIMRTLNKTVIPDMLKMQPQIKSMLDEMNLDAGLSPDDIMESMESLGYNPKWEKFMAESGLDKKMQEMSEMLESGGDVMYATFSRMKTGAFFRDISHWFLPFEADRSEIKGDVSFINSMLETNANRYLCDSDKYSMAFSISSIPAGMMGSMRAQIDEMVKMNREEQENDLRSHSPLFTTEVHAFVKDLYRFFTLYHAHKNYSNPFKNPVLPDRLPVLSESLFDSEFKEMVCEYFFKNGYYSIALPYLESLAAGPDAGYVIYQKAGYALQNVGEYRKALDYYLRASFFDEQEVWLKTAIGNVYLKLGEPENAVRAFEDALSTDDENVHLLLKISQTYILLEKPELALTHLYKLDYIHPIAEAAREIAWGEFMRNDSGKAKEYLGKVIEGKYDSGGKRASQPCDYVRMGHILLSEGNPAEAVKHYSLAASDEKEMRKDWPLLKKKGVSEVDFDLLIESVVLDREKEAGIEKSK